MGKITYKIDRLLSGSDGLQLGLKTGVALKVDSLGENKNNYLKLTRLAGYESNGTDSFTTTVSVPSSWGDYIETANSSEFATNKKLIPTAGWVEGLTAVRVAYVLKYLSEGYLGNGSHINFTYGQTNTALTPNIIINVSPLYSGGNETFTDSQSNVYHTVAPDDDTNTPVTQGNQNLDNATKFITGFETDAYGKITKVYGRHVSTADMASIGNVDNYRGWGLRIAGAAAETARVIGSYYTAQDASTHNSEADLILTSSDAITPEISQNGNAIAFALVVDTDQFTTAQGVEPSVTHKLQLKALSNVEQSTLGLYRTKFDTYGRVIESGAVTSEHINPLVSTFNGSVAGKVPVKDANNTANPANTMYFLNSSANWVNIPYDKVLVSAVENNKTYSLLGVNGFTSSGNYSTATHASAYFDADGTIHGTFAGNGSALQNIVAGNIVAGSSNTHINTSLLDTTEVKAALGISNVGNSGKANQVVINTTTGLDTIPNTLKTSGQTSADGVAVLSINLTANGTVAETPETGWRDLKSLVSTVVAGEGGMRFMGVLGDGTSGTVTWAQAEATFKKGDFYKVGSIVTTAGDNEAVPDYGGYSTDIEVGDTIFAVADKPSGYNSMTSSQRQAYWSVIQSNLVNAVVAAGDTSTLTNGTYYLPVSNTTSLRTLYQSVGMTKSATGWSINAAATSAATADQLTTTRKIWGADFDGTANITGNMLDVGTITPAAGVGENAPSTSTVGTQAAPFAAVYATDVHGTTFHGTADSASQLVRPLILQFGNRTFTFDGLASADADRTFSFDADSLNVFDATEKATNAGTIPANRSANVITDISMDHKAGSGNESILQYTVSTGSMVAGVSSTLLGITYADNVATIAPFTSKPSTLGFYTTDTTLPSGSDVLRLDGVLLASNLKVVTGSASHNVAPKRADSLSSIDVSRNILVADPESNTSGSDYGFIASSVHIANSNIDWNTQSSTIIPTQGAIQEYVSRTTGALSADTKLECIAIPFSWQYTSIPSLHTIPINAVIDHIDVSVDASGFAEAATFDLILTGNDSSNTTIISNSEVDLSSGGDVFSYKFSKTAGTLATNKTGNAASFTPRVSVTTTTTSGSGTCYIYYTKTQLNSINTEGRVQSSLVS